MPMPSLSPPSRHPRSRYEAEEERCVESLRRNTFAYYCLVLFYSTRHRPQCDRDLSPSRYRDPAVKDVVFSTSDLVKQTGIDANDSLQDRAANRVNEGNEPI